MLVRLDGQGGVLYQKLYESLRRAILEGRLAPGSRLPSTRALAAELRVSRNTVLVAYEHLLAEGYAVGRVGSGTYVASELPDELLSARRPWARTGGELPQAVPRLSAYARRLLDDSRLPRPHPSHHGPGLRYDFRHGLPAADFPRELWRRLLARRARDFSRAAIEYGPPEGYGPLREAIADYLGRARAVSCRPEQIVVVNGSQQALDLASRLLVDPGSRVVVEEPHYTGARRAFLAAGARLVPVAVDADGLDVSALPRPASGVRLAYVTPSHQFPTGGVMPLARRLALLGWAEEAGAYVLEDDYDSEFRYEGRPVEAVQGLDRAGRVIYVGTFSKVLLPSLRVGYLVLPRPLVEPFVRGKWVADRHTPTLVQAVLADFIREGFFERHLRRVRASCAARRSALLEALSTYLGGRAEVVGANAGVHLLAWLEGVVPDEMPALVERAASAGVGIYPVAPYYLEPPPRAGLVLGYASMSEREIRAGIRRLGEVLTRRC